MLLWIIRATFLLVVGGLDARLAKAAGGTTSSWVVLFAGVFAFALAADAETVFAAELKRFPNDPHLEFGLAEAFKAQGKDDGAPRAAYKTHWKGTRDLTLADLG